MRRLIDNYLRRPIRFALYGYVACQEKKLKFGDSLFHVYWQAFLLGQLQEILYGAQQRATNVQITTLQNQINEQIETLSNMLNSRLNLLTESIEKKSTTQEQKLNELQSDVEKANTQLQTQISDTRDALQVEIQSSVDRLQNNKLDRKNLAQLLGDVSRELGASVSDVSK